MSHEIYTRLCVCSLLGGYLMLFSHTIKGCFIGSGAIVWLPRCKWSKPEGYYIHSSMCNIFHETCTCMLGVSFRWAHHCIYQYYSVLFQWRWDNRMKMVKIEGGAHTTENAITMMTSSNGNIFRVTGHLCGEFTSPRWIPRTKASDAELWCLLWSAPELTLE